MIDTGIIIWGLIGCSIFGLLAYLRERDYQKAINRNDDRHNKPE